MASVYRPKGRKSYLIKFVDQYGVSRKVNSGIREERAADALAAKLEHDVARIRAGLPADFDAVTGAHLGLSMMGRSWSEFREEHRLRVLASMPPKTQADIAASLDRFERMAFPKSVCDIDETMIDEFVAARRLQPGKKTGAEVSIATVNHDIRYLKSALSWAVRWKYLRRAPCIKTLREPKRLKRYMLPDHFARIYSVADSAKFPEPCLSGTKADWWRGILVTLYMTGWRITQTLRLRRRAVDFESGTVTAFGAAGDAKGRRDSLVALHPVMVDHLLRMTGDTETFFDWPNHRRSLDIEFHRLQREAGINLDCHERHAHTPACHVYSWHDMRRAFATLNAAHMTAETLQHLMQHKSYQTTQGYIQYAGDASPMLPKLFVPDIQPRQPPRDEQAS